MFGDAELPQSLVSGGSLQGSILVIPATISTWLDIREPVLKTGIRSAIQRLYDSPAEAVQIIGGWHARRKVRSPNRRSTLKRKPPVSECLSSPAVF